MCVSPHPIPPFFLEKHGALLMAAVKLPIPHPAAHTTATLPVLTRGLRALNCDDRVVQWFPQGDNFDRLHAELSSRYPGEPRLLKARLLSLDGDAKSRTQRAKAIGAAADAVIASIDAAEIAAHFGTRVRRRVDCDVAVWACVPGW